MLIKEDLREIARLTRLKPYQQEKHYIQIIILSSIYSTSNKLVFKGGTALVFIHSLNRFSDDLDFTSLGRIIEKDKLINSITKNMEFLGIKNNIDIIKENKITTSFRVGAEGPLFTKDIERCYVNVEISKREEVNKYETREIRPLYQDLLPFHLIVMSPEEILAEKVRAILTRNYARDVYDLWFLLEKNVVPDLSLINKKLSYYKNEFNIREFIKNIDAKRDIWKSELKPFIIGNLPEFEGVRKAIIKEFSSLV